jgi:hypothetical protein
MTSGTIAVRSTARPDQPHRSMANSLSLDPLMGRW